MQTAFALQGNRQGWSRAHVPYRNSMMTTVLRDSLGGNTRTAMIATMYTSLRQLDESISTCRFAQRVARVTNQVCHMQDFQPHKSSHHLQSRLPKQDFLPLVPLFVCSHGQRVSVNPQGLPTTKEPIVSFRFSCCRRPDKACLYPP